MLYSQIFESELNKAHPHHPETSKTGKVRETIKALKKAMLFVGVKVTAEREREGEWGVKVIYI